MIFIKNVPRYHIFYLQWCLIALVFMAQPAFSLFLLSSTESEKQPAPQALVFHKSCSMEFNSFPPLVGNAVKYIDLVEHAKEIVNPIGEKKRQGNELMFIYIPIRKQKNSYAPHNITKKNKIPCPSIII